MNRKENRLTTRSKPHEKIFKIFLSQFWFLTLIQSTTMNRTIAKKENSLENENIYFNPENYKKSFPEE